MTDCPPTPFRVAAEPWMKQARCAGMPAELFFPESAGPEQREALRICNGYKDVAPCPVRDECLKYALDHGEEHGIWGGQTERARKRLQRAHPIPRVCHWAPCGREFTVTLKTKGRIYCSTRCAMDARNERNRIQRQAPFPKTGAAARKSA